MPIDPELAAYLESVARELPPPAVVDVAARRVRMEAINRRFPPAADRVARDDHFVTLPGRELFVRIYRSGPGVRPGLVYFHGGGWVAGSVFTHDGACAALAADGEIVVASVEYRRAPENPFPAPNDDACAACRWLADRAAHFEIDPDRLAIGGDSAGAHLAAGAAIEARDRGEPVLALQLLIYPVIEPDFETPSYLAHSVSPTLTRAEMIQFWAHYLPGDLATRDSRAVPSRAREHSGLPPAHVIVAELDPLRDEGVRYAQRLTQAGVAASLVEVAGLAHGFLRAAPYVASARAAQRALGIAAGAALRAV